MRTIKMRPRLAIPLAIITIGSGWATGAILGAPSLSAAATTSVANPTPITAIVGSPKPRQNWRAEGPGLRGPRIGMDLMSVAATDLSTTPASLRTEIQSGKTLAAIATEHGVTPAALTAKLVASATASINSAASSGKITAAQQSSALANLSVRVSSFVNSTPMMHMGDHGPRAWEPPGSTTSAGQIT